MKTGHKILIILVVLVLIVFFANSLTVKSSRQKFSSTEGIGSSQELGVLQPRSSESSAVATKSSSSESSLDSSTEASSRIVIKSGEFNLVVSNVEDSASQMIEYTEKIGGWVVSSNVAKVNETPTGTVTVRVPVAKFEKTMDYFSSLAVKVENEKREGDDVTDEYTDLKSQLRNLEATEKQLLQIMKKANTVSDILNVQKEITTVRGQIEQMKGRIIYIKRSAKMSTITVNLALSEELLPVPSGERWKPQYVAKQAWKGVVAFWRNLAYLLISIAVYALIWIPLLLLLLIICKLRRKRRKNSQNKRKR